MPLLTSVRSWTSFVNGAGRSFIHMLRPKARMTAIFATKVPGVMAIPARGYEFVEEIAPRQTDIVIPKKQASAFFGTSLASYLIGLKVDTLILTGCTTSGCVRASAVDGCQLNFKIVVPEDAVFDRSPTSHAVNLFDMASKYADVMPTADLLMRLHALECGS